MYEYIFTIGCFDRLHKGHITLLKQLKSECNKLIIGIHDNYSIEQIKKITDIQPLDERIKNIGEYAFDIFVIDNKDPTDKIKEYITTHFSNYEPISIGPSWHNNKKVLKYTSPHKPLFIIHDYNDTFDYTYTETELIIRRTDSNKGWGQELKAYPINWCFMRADDNKEFPGTRYINSIMPIKFLPYSNEISTTKLRNYMHDKLGTMNYILHKVANILKANDIPYYLDCGTLLGCIRENSLMEKDTDVDITVHLSNWKKLKAIDFVNYGLIVTRVYEGYPHREDGNMISLKTPYLTSVYCDIYVNPAFPLLTETLLNGEVYSIPVESDLYLTQLYDNWRVPSNYHASTKFHRNNGLVNSEYKKYWDTNYKIYPCNM
jgi:cytidyltransferase-like protein